VKNSLVVLTVKKKKKKGKKKKNAVFCFKKEGLAIFLKVYGRIAAMKLSAELAWMSIHWMRELNMYAVLTSGQSSEEREHRKESKYGGKLNCQAMNMSTSSVRSCYNVWLQSW
jgi:hypothetical protein